MASRRILSIWTPRLGVEWLARREGLSLDAPLATLGAQGQSLRVASLNRAAEAAGVRLDQSAADARAVCTDLRTRPADPAAERAFLGRLRRWAERFSPHVAADWSAQAEDAAAHSLSLGLTLDVTGAAHLFGGEAALAEEVVARLGRAGLSARAGVADGKGAAWALARYGAAASAARIAPPGESLKAIAALPIAALRLDRDALDGLRRLGLAAVADVARLPRAGLARRFGVKSVTRLDQATGATPEPIAPTGREPHFAARLSLPEPIGLLADLNAALERLLQRVSARLEAAQKGARRLHLTLRRVDREAIALEIGLARPHRDPSFIAPLFAKRLGEVDTGYGVDAMRLEATVVEALAPRQTRVEPGAGADRRREADPREEGDAMAALLSRLGARLGEANILRLRPGERLPPDRAVIAEAAAYAPPAEDWTAAARRRPPRPIETFAPEPLEIVAEGAPMRPPARFRWRGREHAVAVAVGPERIAPEWWLDDPAWRAGLRDYWRVETREALRLHLFFTPQAPSPEPPAMETRWRVAGRFA